MDANTIPNTIIAITICVCIVGGVFHRGIRYAFDRWVAHRDHVAELRHPEPAAIAALRADAQARVNGDTPTEVTR